MIVIVIVFVAVVGPVIVALHVHGNATVVVIERVSGSMSFVSMVTTRSQNSIPWTYRFVVNKTTDPHGVETAG